MARPGTLRIIAGTAGGHRLSYPKEVKIRPTADRVRESLFNILGPSVVDARVLDIFAGTGAFGIEALSRGAAFAQFVERRRACAGAIGANLQKTHLAGRADIIVTDAFSFPGKRTFDEPFSLIFLDPPYRFSLDCSPGTKTGDLLVRLTAPELLTQDGWIVLEHSGKAHVPENIGPVHLTDRRDYGTAGISFFAVD